MVPVGAALVVTVRVAVALVGAARCIGDNEAELGAAVGQRRRLQRVAVGLCAVDVDTVSLPLVRQWLLPGRCRREGRRLSRHHRGIDRIRGDCRFARERHLVNDARIVGRVEARQVVQAAVRTSLHIDHANAGRQELIGRSGGRIEHVNPPATRITEEVLADVAGGECLDRGVVERAPGNRAAGGVR